jgi:hypothetical protein
LLLDLLLFVTTLLPSRKLYTYLLLLVVLVIGTVKDWEKF